VYVPTFTSPTRAVVCIVAVGRAAAVIDLNRLAEPARIVLELQLVSSIVFAEHKTTGRVLREAQEVVVLVPIRTRRQVASKVSMRPAPA
jgi:hypothetical protein